jgi:hypothetical protein
MKKQIPDFQLRIVDFKIHAMEIDEPSIKVPIEVFEKDSNIVVAYRNYWFQSSEIDEKTDEEVLTMIFSLALGWAQGVIENISETTLNNIELTNRYAKIVGSVIDIPETAAELDTQVEAAMVDKIKDRTEWEIPLEEPIEIIEIPEEVLIDDIEEVPIELPTETPTEVLTEEQNG